MPKKKKAKSSRKKAPVRAKKKSPPKKKKAAAGKPKAVKKKPAAKKPAAKKKLSAPLAHNAAASTAYKPASNETKLGEVEDFFGNISVIALTLKSDLAVGNTIHVRGHTTDIEQKVVSMQIEHASVPKAKKGDGVGIKIGGKCRKGDDVYRVG